MLKKISVAALAATLSLALFTSCASKKPVETAPVADAHGVIPVKETFEPTGVFPADKFMKVAAVQWSLPEDANVAWDQARTNTYLQNNRESLAKQVRVAAAKGAKLVVLPEFGVTGYPDIPELSSEDDNFRDRKDVKNFVEPIPGPTTEYFSKLSKELGIWIQVGFAEVDKKTDRYHNAAVVVDPSGQIVAKYRKQNFYGKEGDFLSAGKKNATFKTPAGKMGVLICADTYSKKVVAQYKKDKVDVLLNSAAWAQTNSGITHFVSTAKETGAYYIASNFAWAPDAAVLNPDGTEQSHVRQTANAIVYGYLPLKK